MKNKVIFDKKLITSLLSIIVVAGMAIQSFATNVDMAAFVKKDKYMSKYYELDWRIDEIEGELERLYKFVCTNVVSFGGGDSSQYRSDMPFNHRVTTPTYHWEALPVVEFSTEGYLRFNLQDMLYSYGNHSKTDRFEREIPASLCKWKNGFELQPNTKIKVKLQRIAPASGTSVTKTLTYEVIIGPFKKVPYFTTTGAAAGAWMTSNAFFWPYESAYTMYYDYNKETEPTSWSTTMSNGTYFGSVHLARPSYPTGLPTELRYDYDIANLGYKYENYNKGALLYNNGSTVTDLSSRTNVWYRLYSSWTGEMTSLNLSDYTLTTWNYNK